MASHQPVPSALHGDPGHDAEVRKAKNHRTVAGIITALLAVLTIGCGAAAPTPAPELTAPVITAGAPSGGENRETKDTAIPPPPTGVCDRSEAVREAITLAAGEPSCSLVTNEQVRQVEQITLDTSPPAPGDLAGMSQLRTLEIRGLNSSIPRDAFSGAEQLRKLSIQTGEPEGSVRRDIRVEEGALRNLDRLESLTVGGVEGSAEHTLTAETLRGLENLRTIRMDYLRSVDSQAFQHTPLIREIRLHGTRREDESHPKISKEIFAGLARLRTVEVRNFRWPPVLEVQNEKVACSATRWVSFKHNPSDGKRPLSVLIEGEYSRQKDVEDMLGCGEAR